MNWIKIKTIIIYFLVAMNLFMAAYIALTTLRESRLPDEVVEASLKILRRDGFKCDKDVIPTKTYKLPVLDATFYTPDTLSEIFFGKQLPFKTDKNALVALDGEAKLEVSGIFFSFDSSEKSDKSHSEKAIKKALTKVGFNMEGAAFDEEERCFYKMYKGINLFNMYVKAELDKNGNICSIAAQWPIDLSARSTETLSFTPGVTKVKDAFPHPGTIEHIEPGYALSHQGGNRYIFKPSWRVKIGKELKILE